MTEFTATAGQTSFSVPSYTVGFIDVYRNGVMLGSADYTATNGTTVVLASGATAGDLVEVISFQVSSVLNAIAATAGSVGTTYLADASVTQAKLASNVVGVGPAFSATLTTQITGAGSGYYSLNSTAFTEQYDYGSGFNASTGVFTAPVTGIYLFNLAFSYTSNGASTDCNFELIVDGSTYTVNAYNPSLIGAVAGVDGAFWIQQPIMVYLAATKTAYMRFYTNDASWNLATQTRFQGVLLRNV